MGIDFSKVSGSGIAGAIFGGNGTDDLHISGVYQSRIHLRDQDNIVNLLIGGMKNAGKSTLFRYLQKSSAFVTNTNNLPLFSTSIMWENPISKEKANVREMCFSEL